jgi:hypothetical protein
MNELFQIIILLGFTVFAWYSIDFITGKKSNKEKKPVKKKPVKKKFKLTKGIYYLIGANLLFYAWLFFYIESNTISPSENSTSDCNEFDKTGRYENLALNRVRNVSGGCMITGNQFFGDSYFVQAVCPKYGGPVDVEIKINICGEVVFSDVDL